MVTMAGRGGNNAKKRSLRVKVITMGDAAAGKSCLIKRFCERRFVEKYVSTIGIDYGVTVVKAAEREVKVNFFDMSGHYLFTSVRAEFYKDVQGAMLVYDVTSLASFESLDEWVAEMSKALGEEEMKGVVVMVCANKVDCRGAHDRAVSESMGRFWAENRGFKYFETSASSGDGVEAMFNTLFSDVVTTMESGVTERAAKPTYSQKEMDAVRRVEQSRNNYERLGVPQGASVEDINRSYRKLARVLHPDKNRAPGSEEAFKAVCSAKNALLGNSG